jgi:hypothetical protein
MLSIRNHKKTRKTKKGGVWPFFGKPAANPVENKPAQQTEQKEFEFTCLTVHYDYDTYVVEIIGVLKVENCPFLFKASGFLTENINNGHLALNEVVNTYFQKNYPHLVSKIQSAIMAGIVAKKNKIDPAYKELKISRIAWIDISIEIFQNTIGYCAEKTMEDAINKYVVSQYAFTKTIEEKGIKADVNNMTTYDGKDVDLLKSAIQYHTMLKLNNEQTDLSALALAPQNNENGMSGGMAAVVILVLFATACNAMQTTETMFTKTPGNTPGKQIKVSNPLGNVSAQIGLPKDYLDTRPVAIAKSQISGNSEVVRTFVNSIMSGTPETVFKDVSDNSAWLYGTVNSQTSQVIQKLRTTHNIDPSIDDVHILTDALKSMLTPTHINFDDETNTLSMVVNNSNISSNDADEIIAAMIHDCESQINNNKPEIGKALTNYSTALLASGYTGLYEIFDKQFNELNDATVSAKPGVIMTSQTATTLESVTSKYIETVKLMHQIELLQDVQKLQRLLHGNNLDVATINDLTTFNTRLQSQLDEFEKINTKQDNRLKLNKAVDPKYGSDIANMFLAVQDAKLELATKTTEVMKNLSKQNKEKTTILEQETRHWFAEHFYTALFVGILAFTTAGSIGIAAFAFPTIVTGGGKASATITKNICKNAEEESNHAFAKQQLKRKQELEVLEHKHKIMLQDLNKLDHINDTELKKTADDYGLVVKDTSDLMQRKAALDEKIREEIKTHESAIAVLKEHVNANIDKKAVETFKKVTEYTKQEIEAAIIIQKAYRSHRSKKQTKKDQSGGRKRKSVRKSRKH